MNPEAVSRRIAGLRTELDGNPAAVNKLLRKMKATKEEDHKAILSCLKAIFAINIELGMASSTSQPRLHTRLEALGVSIRSHLVHMTDIKKETDSLSRELKEISSSLQSCLQNGENILLQASEEAVEEGQKSPSRLAAEQQKQRQLQMSAEAEEAEITLQERLGEEMAQLQTLDDKIGRNRHKRVGLRAARAVMWGATLVFPPAAVVAAGMEVGAHKIRKKARIQEAARHDQASQVHSLVQNIQKSRLSPVSPLSTNPPPYGSISSAVSSKEVVIVSCSPVVSNAFRNEIQVIVPDLINTTDGLQIQIDKLLVPISQSSLDQAKELFRSEKLLQGHCIQGYKYLSRRASGKSTNVARAQEKEKQVRDWFGSDATEGNNEATKCLADFLAYLKCPGASLDEVLSSR